MESTFHSPFQLVLKNDTWVPRPKKHLSILDQHGIELKQTLGEGSYAKVKLGYSSKEEKNVAVKLFEKRRLPRSYVEKFLLREIKILTAIQHPHVISLMDIFETPSRIYMVLELAANGDLLEFINNKNYNTEEQIKLHFQQIVSGLSACHKQLIVHRDLKCENILLDTKNNVKLGDFGFSRDCLRYSLLDTFCGSFAYSSPELIAGKTGYDGFAADCWSLGVILYCMLCGRLPYEREELISLSKGKRVKSLRFHDEVSKEAKVVVKKLLQPDRLQRYTCVNLEQCDWCNGYQVGLKDTPDHFNDVIAAQNTVAAAQNENPLNMLAKTVRPNFGKTFHKAISRQRFNLIAINAFKISNASKSSTSSASFYKPTNFNERRCSVVSEILSCEKMVAGERRKTIENEKQLSDELRPKQLVKDMEMKAISTMKPILANKSFMISQNKYENFLKKKQEERHKECSDVTRSTCSVITRTLSMQKQLSKANTYNKSECFFEAETGSDQHQVEWARKCMMSCSRKH